MPRSSPIPKLTLLAVSLLALTSIGCVQRRLTIRTDPPGATVFVDDREIGISPVSTPFTYYGTRDIRVVRDGYETQRVKEKISAPWYEYPPLDFFSENFAFREIRDDRFVDITLVPQQVVPAAELLRRGDELRYSAAPTVALPPGIAPPGILPPPTQPVDPGLPAAPTPAGPPLVPPPSYGGVYQ